MPFKSESQRRYCWYLYQKATKAGKTPSWDCKEWARETKNQSLPKYKKEKTIRHVSMGGAKRRTITRRASRTRTRTRTRKIKRARKSKRTRKN